MLINRCNAAFRLLPAVVAVCFAAGCGGGGSVAPRAAIDAQASASGGMPAAAFEQRRAAWERTVRSSIPSGYHIELGSTYVTKTGKLTYNEFSIAMKTPHSIGFAVGSNHFVYNRGDLDEIPNTSLKATPPSHHPSGGRTICNPDDGCGAGDPTPPPDPTPSDPADLTFDATATTPQADNIASTRQAPCNHQYNNNGYPGSYMEWTGQNVNTWTLHYTPGYPFFDGGLDSLTGNTSIALIDGTVINNMIQGGFAAEGVEHTVSLIYRDDLRKVGYAAITLYDYVTPRFFTDTVYSEDRISCPNDSGIYPPTPPGPTDPGPGNGNGGGWGSHQLRPQPPR